MRVKKCAKFLSEEVGSAVEDRRHGQIIMSILNLGLQCVGLVREKMLDEYESEAAKCNSLSELRKMAKRKDGFVNAVKDGLSPVKILSCTIFSCLQLKEKSVQNFTSVTKEKLSDFW